METEKEEIIKLIKRINKADKEHITNCKECLEINKNYPKQEWVYCASCELKRINPNGVIKTK